MRKPTHLFSLVTGLAVVLGSTLTAGGAESGARDPKIDAVLTRFVEAIGGRAAVEKQTTRVLKGSLEGLGMPPGATWQMTAKAPNKQVSEVDIAGLGKMLDGFDGQVGWSKNPFAGLRVKEGPELAKLKRDADFYRDLHLQTTYSNLTYKGPGKAGTNDVEWLEARPTPDSLERMGFDAKTGLLLRQQSEFEMNEGRVKLDITFEDYRAVDGIRFPHTMRFNMESPGQPPAEFNIKVLEVRHGVTVADAVFAKPAS